MTYCWETNIILPALMFPYFFHLGFNDAIVAILKLLLYWTKKCCLASCEFVLISTYFSILIWLDWRTVVIDRLTAFKTLATRSLYSSLRLQYAFIVDLWSFAIIYCRIATFSSSPVFSRCLYSSAFKWP